MMRISPMAALKTSLAAAGAFAAALTFAPAARAEIYGLVIGIDRYRYVTELEGAVNDARIVAQALRDIGAKEVIELMDERARRDAVVKAWKTIAAKTKPGDTVYLAYAGHGAQSPERIPGSEADGLDEFFVLTDFEPDTDNNYERILDDDLQYWFSQLPDRNIVLLADSCHSGTMTRAYNESKLKYRMIKVREIANDKVPPLENPAVANENLPPPEHVMSISAVADNELDPEIRIDGKPHGALSWFFAQGLRSGQADADKNREIGIAELTGYLREKVQALTEGQQHPQFRYVADRIVANATQAGAETAQANGEDALSFAIAAGPNAQTLVDWSSKRLRRVKLVDPKAAQLEWNPQEQVLKNAFDDVVYRIVATAPNPAGDATRARTKAFKRLDRDQSEPPEEALEQVQSVVDKFLAIDRINRLSDGTMTLALLPNDKLHRNGEEVALTADKMKYPFFTLFNLASDGSVNFLYPSVEGDAPTLPQGQAYTLKLQVSPPFGADHFVAVASDAQLTNLHKALKAADGKRQDLTGLMQTLGSSLRGAKYQIGVHPTYTGE